MRVACDALRLRAEPTNRAAHPAARVSRATGSAGMRIADAECAGSAWCLSVTAVLATAAATFLAIGTPAVANRPLAWAVVHDASGAKIGVVVFKGSGRYAQRVEVRLALPADAPGLGAYHGLHVHQVGECIPPFTSAGGHWNLDSSATHGAHTGDLPSVLIGPNGTAYAEFETHRFNITELLDADGSAVVLHAGPDNFGNVAIGPDRYSDPTNWYNAPGGTAATGDAGGRYGCGVVRAR